MGNTQSSRFNRIDWLAKGPFAPHIEAYKQYLTDRGYAANTFSHCMGSIAHFAQWMRSRRLEAMHWVLDVTFREDDCRVRKGHAAQNLSAIRKFALSALRNNNKHLDRSLRRRRKLADRRPAYRAELLGLKPRQ